MDKSMSSTKTPLLQVNQVTKTFGGIFALNEVSFDLHAGEILGVIGPNGSGKTTLVNCITGFIEMTSGEVRYRGKKISGKPPHKIADMGITRTFQIMRPYYSLPAYKNLVIPLFRRGQNEPAAGGVAANWVIVIRSALTFWKNWVSKENPLFRTKRPPIYLPAI
jgi:ABC-type branched-subunit amino acid transport system ATPase component